MQKAFENKNAKQKLANQYANGPVAESLANTCKKLSPIFKHLDDCFNFKQGIIFILKEYGYTLLAKSIQEGAHYSVSGIKFFICMVEFKKILDPNFIEIYGSDRVMLNMLWKAVNHRQNALRELQNFIPPGYSPSLLPSQYVYTDFVLDVGQTYYQYLKKLIESDGQTNTAKFFELFYRAVSYGFLDLADHLLTKLTPQQWEKELGSDNVCKCLQQTATNGSLNGVIYLWQKTTAKVRQKALSPLHSTYCIMAPTSAGHLNILTWFWSQIPPAQRDKVFTAQDYQLFSYALKEGYIPMLDWLWSIATPEQRIDISTKLETKNFRYFHIALIKGYLNRLPGITTYFTPMQLTRLLSEFVRLNFPVLTYQVPLPMIHLMRFLLNINWENHNFNNWSTNHPLLALLIWQNATPSQQRQISINSFKRSNVLRSNQLNREEYHSRLLLWVVLVFTTTLPHEPDKIPRTLTFMQLPAVIIMLCDDFLSLPDNKFSGLVDIAYRLNTLTKIRSEAAAAVIENIIKELISDSYIWNLLLHRGIVIEEYEHIFFEVLMNKLQASSQELPIANEKYDRDNCGAPRAFFSQNKEQVRLHLTERFWKDIIAYLKPAQLNTPVRTHLENVRLFLLILSDQDNMRYHSIDTLLQKCQLRCDNQQIYVICKSIAYIVTYNNITDLSQDQKELIDEIYTTIEDQYAFIRLRQHVMSTIRDTLTCLEQYGHIPISYPQEYMPQI